MKWNLDSGRGFRRRLVDSFSCLGQRLPQTDSVLTAMKQIGCLAALTLLVPLSACQSHSPQSTHSSPPLRVFIRASAKTHGPGEHDYPRFLADWTQLLTERGAVVEGALAFPSEAQLAKTDVLLVYASDAGSISEPDRTHLEAYLRRGGGIVVLHDGLCGKDADWFKTLIGGAKQHGVTNWNRGKMTLHFQDTRHPITKGLSDFEIDDELFFRLHMMPQAKILATTLYGEGQVVPQLWAYETDHHRAFVSCQGHWYASFSLPYYRGLLLRGIAWAGKREVDLLTSGSERASFNVRE
jgi:type 1 glutamine amidotransferase